MKGKNLFKNYKPIPEYKMVVKKFLLLKNKYKVQISLS
jgi:hypothetical protein